MEELSTAQSAQLLQNTPASFFERANSLFVTRNPVFNFFFYLQVLCSEMPKACDRMKSTGRNVLMAVQRLQAEPHSEEAKENMVTAARRLLQATVKVFFFKFSNLCALFSCAIFVSAFCYFFNF